jgi:NAD-dependent SIR2 family protein deacetylase
MRNRLPTRRHRRSSSSLPPPQRRRPAAAAADSSPQQPPPQCCRRRRRERGPAAALESLARSVVLDRASVVIITGAGLSVPSGVRPFRRGGGGGGGTRSSAGTTPSSSSPPPQSADESGIWHDVIWTTATRAAFRKDPAHWYATFWNVYFDDSKTKYQPNNGHLALDRLLDEYENVRQITQNIDGLQKAADSRDRDDANDDNSDRRFVEAHGRLGYYKCCPDFDSSDDDDDDDDDDDEEESSEDNKNTGERPRRPAHLGHRRKARIAQKTRQLRCPYQYDQTITKSQLANVDDPKCPHCGNPAMPQALLFDEGYHSHSYYQFEQMEDWLASADILVFIGTSFAAVRLTQVALDVAKQNQLPVYNINLYDTLDPTPRLSVANIVGSAETQLPLLLSLCDHLQNGAGGNE